MNELPLEYIQTVLKVKGYYDGIVDGDWGPMSKKAFEKAMSTVPLNNVKSIVKQVAPSSVKGVTVSDVCTQLQASMQTLGTYAGKLDGDWGAKSHAAFLESRKLVEKSPANMTPMLKSYCSSLPWSAKVSPLFIEKLKYYCEKLSCSPDILISCIAFETGETFSPTIKNGAGAPYYGLIQFGAAAATDAGTSIEALLKMTAEEQLEYVYRFFKPYTGKLKTVSDIYSRIIWPRAVGKPEDYVIFFEDAPGKAYAQNKGLDINKDGKITKAEAAAKVQQKLVAGFHPKNIRPT